MVTLHRAASTNRRESLCSWLCIPKTKRTCRPVRLYGQKHIALYNYRPTNPHSCKTTTPSPARGDATARVYLLSDPAVGYPYAHEICYLPGAANFNSTRLLDKVDLVLTPITVGTYRWQTNSSATRNMSHSELSWKVVKEEGSASQSKLMAVLNQEGGIAACRYRSPVLWHQERRRS